MNIQEQLKGKRKEVLEAGVSRATAGRLLYGDCNPKIGTVKKLADAGLIKIDIPLTAVELEAAIGDLHYSVISEASGVAAQYISKYVRGLIEPKLSTVIKIVDSLEEARQLHQQSINISDADVQKMRELYGNGEVTYKDIGEIYGVSESYVCRLVKNDN